jgi:hypothetical protein
MTARPHNKMMNIFLPCPSSTRQLTGPLLPAHEEKAFRKVQPSPRASGEREGAQAPGEGNLGDPS